MLSVCCCQCAAMRQGLLIWGGCVTLAAMLQVSLSNGQGGNKRPGTFPQQHSMMRPGSTGNLSAQPAGGVLAGAVSKSSMAGNGTPLARPAVSGALPAFQTQQRPSPTATSGPVGGWSQQRQQPGSTQSTAFQYVQTSAAQQQPGYGVTSAPMYLSAAQAPAFSQAQAYGMPPTSMPVASVPALN